MDLKYACIIDHVENAFQGKAATVVVLGGSSLKTEFGFFGPMAIATQDCSEISVESLVSHLKAQKANVDCVLITGAEPLQQFEAIFNLLAQLRDNGFQVKLETTGFYADNLEKILSYVDAIAMDLKADFDANTYAKLTGFRGEPATLMQETLRSIMILKAYKLKKPDFFVEFRTTIIPSINDSEMVIEKLAGEVKFADAYALQQFISDSKLADENLRQFGTSTKPRLIDLALAAKKHLKNVYIRTRDDGEQLVE